MDEVVDESLDKCRLLSSVEVLKFLKISKTQLYYLCHLKINALPSVKIGRSRRYPFNKVRVWVENLGN